VAVGGPYLHDRLHCPGLGAQERTDPPDRDLINVVPPRPSRHKLGVEPGDKVDALVGRIGAIAGQCDGGIALLAVSCGPPQQLGGAQPGRSILQWMIRKYDLEQGLLARRGHAIEGHRRFHVRLYARRLHRIGCGLQAGTHCIAKIMRRISHVDGR
jgi:hypothetical protein